MSSNNNKRKNNRIQGGWGKPDGDKHKQSPRQSNNFVNMEGIKYDYNQKYEDIRFKCIPIKKDISLDLNSQPESGLESNLVYFKASPSQNQIKSEAIAEHVLVSSDQHPAIIELKNQFISKKEAGDLFYYFQEFLPWSQKENATIYGEKYLEPRKTCWYGLPYAYSKVKLSSNNNWDEKLSDLLHEVQKFSSPDRPFNSVMCNLYEGNKHSIDWHADDEKGLGKSPTIASISLGATRVFELCRRSELFDGYNKKRRNPYRSRNVEEPPFDDCSILYQVYLESGSLLLMSGSLQESWLHRVPKEYHDYGPRINFTFRHIELNKE